MKPVRCLGGNDCYRACIASILGLPPKSVPNVYGGPGDVHEQTAHMRAWLTANHGLTIFQTWCSGKWPIDQALHWFSSINPGAPFILSGACRGSHHAVVVMDGKIAHDPSGAGIEGPCSDGNWWFDVIAVAAVWRAVA